MRCIDTVSKGDYVSKIGSFIRDFLAKTAVLLPNSFLNFVANSNLIIATFRVLHISKLCKVRSIGIHITNKCDLNCIYCYSERNGCKGLSNEKIHSLISEVRDNGIRKIAFLGGEPLLNPDIFSFINECYDKGITSYLYTNGVHIDEDVIAKLLNFKDKLVLVFNFDHPKTYAKHKLNDFYDQVYENIKRCKKKRFKIVLFVALTKLNFPFFEDILLIGKKLGVKVKVERYVPLNDAKVNNGLELSAEEWCFAQETYKKIYPRRYITNLIYKKVMKSNCVCYNEALFVMFNGDVLPCPYTTSDFRIGDVNHSPLKQIIKKYDVLKVEWNKIPKGCKGCEKADYCRGGCKTSRFLDHNSLEKKQDCCCK